jgi:NAD+ synthase
MWHGMPHTRKHSMAETLTIALAQINPTLGDTEGNSRKIAAAHAEAVRAGADLVVTPELSISGYPPEDLVCRPAYIDACMEAAKSLATQVKNGPPLVVGLPWASGQGFGAKPYNAAALLQEGEIKNLWFKYDLPNYGIFDDKRVFNFSRLDEGKPFALKGARIGVVICEDMWSKDKAAQLKKHGAQLIVTINASPIETDKHHMRRATIAARVKETGLPIAYLNQVGGQDEVVFDGGSFVMSSKGDVTASAGCFQEKLLLTRWTKKGSHLEPVPGDIALEQTEEEILYRALVTGLRDYVQKNGFPCVLLGLSGGIDSALVAVLAVDALGKDKVTTVMMPSPYTAQESLEDAKTLAANLGSEHRVVSIEAAMSAVGNALAPNVKGLNTDIMDQNIQSRLRGVILMGLSNAMNGMVLACGNKSEMATGYATLYGDMCGGYAPIKDVYKTLVYKLSEWRNASRPEGLLGPAGVVIPENILTRAPSAELKPNQTDQDTLPPYDVLDDILQCLIEKEMSLKEAVGRGHDAAVVEKVLRMLKNSEYKRQQAAPGTKITSRAFGRDRRYPKTNRFVK